MCHQRPFLVLMKTTHYPAQGKKGLKKVSGTPATSRNRPSSILSPYEAGRRACFQFSRSEQTGHSVLLQQQRSSSMLRVLSLRFRGLVSKMRRLVPIGTYKLHGKEHTRKTIVAESTQTLLRTTTPFEPATLSSPTVNQRSSRSGAFG